MSNIDTTSRDSERSLTQQPSEPTHSLQTTTQPTEAGTNLRRSARFSGQHQASTATDSTSSRSAGSKRKRGAEEETESTDHPEAEPSSNRRRPAAATAPQSEPSAKALGKRRAISPPSAESAATSDPTQSTSSKPSKRRKSNTSIEPSKTSKPSTYNLRNRQQVSPSSATNPTPHTTTEEPEQPKETTNMPKKSGKAGGNKTRSRADQEASTSAALEFENHEEDMLPPSGDRANKKRSKRTPKTSAQAQGPSPSEPVAPDTRPEGSTVPMEVGEPIDDDGDHQEHGDVDFSFFEGGEDDFYFGDENDEIIDAQFEGEHEPEDEEEEEEDMDEEDDEDDLGEEFSAAMLGDDHPDGAGPGGHLGSAASMLFGGFGASLASFGMMSGLGTRLKSILNQLRDTSAGPDPTQKVVALQELSEILSISTEDTLAGFFNIDAFVKEFISILSVGSDCASVVDLYGEETGVEMMLLACRCLANLMEALPGSSHSVVHAGAVPVLCSKLLEIQYIDLAEQTLSTLEKIASEVPGAVVREGGLTALLSYLDFFSTNIQRTAVTAAAHCCRSLSQDSFNMVRDVMPILRNVLGYSDQRVVEQACLAVTRIIESYKHYPDKLEALLTPELISAVLSLLTPGSSLLGSSTFTSVLRALALSARASPKVAMELIEGNISGTLYHLLAGSAPPSSGEEIAGVQKRREEDDMAVLQNLVHRPKDQVLEALVLVSELLPALPRDGLFNSKPNASRSKAAKKLVKVKREDDTNAPVLGNGALAGPIDLPGSSVAENEASGSTAEQAANFSAQSLVRDEEAITSAAQIKTEERSPSVDLSSPVAPTASGSASTNKAQTAKETANDHRIELLQSDTPPERKTAVARFQALLLPTLIDVYSASVGISVRAKSMLGLTKIMHFATKEQLEDVLQSLPIASFLGAILASKDQPTLVTNGLQVVELLLIKLPNMCNYLFRRQGVLHEVEQLAQNQLLTPQDKPQDKPETENQAPPSSTALPGGSSRGFLLGSLARASASAAEMAANEAANNSHLKDLVTLRARFMRDRYCSANANSASAIQAAKDLQTIRAFVQKLETATMASVQKAVLNDISKLFTNTSQPISSFELQESGLIDALLKFAIDAQALPAQAAYERRKILAEALMGQSEANSPQALAVLVKCLQDSLSRLEDFEVKTALPGASDDRRNPAHILTRQLKFKLVAEDSVVPRSCSNVIVAIHAIATFQAFNEYLRPRIAAASGGGGAGSVLAAAFEAAAAASAQADESEGQAPVPSGAINSAEDQNNDDSSSSRRRSSRLSRKPSGADLAQSSAGTPQDATQDPIDEQVTGDTSRDEATTNLEPAADGSAKLEGHTPGGTRVATPSGTSRPSPMPARARGSYASALKTTPSDWHLKFYMGDQELSLDTTVYGAVHQFEAAQNNQSARTMWSNVYTIRFKKCPGPPTAPSPRSSPEPADEDVNLVTSLPDSVSPDSKEAKILQLLRVLHHLNSDLPELLDGQSSATPLPVLTFVNNKLTAKLNRQLEEPMIVASSCLPDWALDLPQSFPFLFPFESRFSFLQSTSFGYARLIAKWVAAARQESRRDDSLSSLGRISRQKVRISRDMLLGSAFKVFELYATSRAMIEIEFFSEVGTGLGPTLEFYALVSREFSRKDLGIWRAGDDNPTDYIQSKTGLFPAPLPADENSERTERAISMFRLLAQFLAKGLLDSRMTDVAFNRTFMKLIQEQELPLTVPAVKTVDPSLGKSLEDLRAFADARERVLADDSIEDKSHALQSIRIKNAAIEDLSLDFTLPGYPDIELKTGGSDISVSLDNVGEYVDLVVEYTLKRGVERQVKTFREAFSQVFPVKDLACFSPEELSVVFGSGEEDWSLETLQDALRADHGFSMESKPVKELLDILHSFPEAERRLFLRFATGSPRLPVGGFRALHPPLTVVRKPPESGHVADEYLPSVMTCQNYIKLPEYSARAVMESRLNTAITEGQGAFHLS